MGEPLKNAFDERIPRHIAGMITPIYPEFPATRFVDDACRGFAALALMPRGRQIAHALRQHLPPDYDEAVKILTASLGPKLERTDNNGMAPFLYLPHVLFVATYGLDHVEASLRAQYDLTQRFTAEFSIRPFLERHPEVTLARLAVWATDSSEHVRRLVSEGTRPRLPWAPRLRTFMADPRPVLDLLELLKDDSSLYVRRSVANNLNDIGKDHPDRLVETARRWWRDASEDRRWLVRHALRTAVKRGDRDALAVLGYGGTARAVEVQQVTLTPPRVRIGGGVRVSLDVVNTARRPQGALVDLVVHFVKANGKTRPKVFKLRELSLAPCGRSTVSKTISLARLTTRVPYRGRHQVDVLINGRSSLLGHFDVC